MLDSLSRLPELLGQDLLQMLAGHVWKATGLPCHIEPPPLPESETAYAGAPLTELPAADRRAIRAACARGATAGEIIIDRERRYTLFPILAEGVLLGTIVLGGYRLDPPDGSPTAGPAQDSGAELPRLTEAARDRAVEICQSLLGVIAAVMETNLAGRKAERGLLQLRQKYSGIFDGVLDGILVEDEAGNILEANLSPPAMHGNTREEMLTLTVRALLPPDRPLLLRPGIWVPHPVETYDRRKDGSVFPVELTGNTLDVDGSLWLVVVVRDITARVQAENSARQSQARLELALEAAGAGLWDYDLLYGRDTMSPGWFTMLGYQPGELPCSIDTWRGLLHPQDAGRAVLVMEQHLAGLRATYEVEFRLRAKDGSWLWIQCRGKVTHRDAQGKALRISGTHTDISLHKKMELSRQASEEKFYKAFQISPDAMIITRASDSIFLDINDQFIELTGFSREEVIGKNVTDVAVWADPAEREELHRCMSASDQVSGMDMTFRRKDGSLRQGAISVRTLNLEGVPCMLSSVRDVTPQRESREMLLDTHMRLQWAYEATLMGWNKALEMRDVATRRHSERCTELTLRLAEAAGIHADEQLTFIRYGAILHDIGKLAIPDIILNKPGALNAEEWNIMRRHPLYAQEMLQGIDYLQPVLPLVASHHERWDGTGYPLGLAGEQIPLEARIFAIVDVWDSMTTPRPYRAAISEELVREHIQKNAGAHFDPRLTELFLSLIARA